MTSKIGEYEAKLKKMRDIFGQATRNIDKYRATIQSQGQTISRVNEELADAQQQLTELNNTVISQKHELLSLDTKLKSARSNHQGEMEQRDASQRHLQQQLDQLKQDYDQYKQRAHQLLEKRQSPASDHQMTQLQDQLKRLTMENMDHETTNSQQQHRISLLDADLRQSLDRLRDLQAKLSSMDAIKQQVDDKQRQIEQLEQQAQQDKEHHEKALKTLQAAHDRLLKEMTPDSPMITATTPSPNTQSPVLARALVGSPLSRRASPDPHVPQPQQQQSDDPRMPQRQLTPQEKEQQDAMDKITEYLNDDNARLRELVATKDQELEKLQKQIAMLQNQDPAAATGNTNSHPASPTQKDHTAPNDKMTYQPSLDVYSSMVNLLSPLVVKPQEDKTDYLEKQVFKLQDLLQDNEDQLAALRTQEKVLKAEIRKLDGVDKRQNMSNEYIKNVTLKFLVAENKQALLPILAKVLFLDSQETELLRKAFQ
ncbi:hypothetical protein BC940DRAFT_80653 [Gongronella butleri]|nr:hypothetical protein BC940DRAFT_80653 [Gongronella butleri]